MKRYFLACLSWLVVLTTNAQEGFPVNGPVKKPGVVYAFTHATIHTDHTTALDDATMVIKDDRIIAVGKGISIPQEAVVVDAKGKHIYPSFIELHSGYGVKTSPPSRDNSFTPQLDSKKEGPYNWNEAIRPEMRAAELFSAQSKDAQELRKLGFGTVLTHYTDGIMRGSGAVVTLADDRDNRVVLKPNASMHLSFNKGSSRQTYPSSLMGSIALIRQTYLDAQWYSNPANRDHTNISLQAINDNKTIPHFFEAGDKLNILRAAKIGKEAGYSFIFIGGGDEYQRLDELKSFNPKLVIPVDFPEAYEVGDPYDAQFVSLKDLKEWEQAPANASMLAKNGFSFSFTSNGLKEKKDFLPNLRKAVLHGLSEADALKALTTNPASFAGCADKLGALRSGYTANFIICSGNVFEKKSKILENWVQGQAYAVEEQPEETPEGKYSLKINDLTLDLNIQVEGNKVKGSIPFITNTDGKSDTAKVDVKGNFNRNLISILFDSKKEEHHGVVRLSGTFDGNGNISGKGQLGNGDWVSFVATRKASEAEKTDKTEKGNETEKPELGPVLFPNMAYGTTTLPKAKTMLIKNATVWTNEKDGILKNADVLISGGKISGVGKGLSAAGAEVVDGTGMHLTPGIIDEHSHIAISRGVNEGGQAVSAEVSIGDVVNSDDVNIYRQLAGGVTAAQLLHGSANPIGGQSALIKLKYGYAPEEMKIKGADGFIKFALGENVKQSNWGDFNTIRYPQTRMGVEQIMKDAFIRAKEYDALRKSKGAAVRKDLEMETLLEILNSKRFISCHSYVQSEINMLMKLADSLGFRVNTFTHILEGYKVADKMAKHGAAGSTFSDWWAYKYEVKDAIPYNANLMQSQGVVVAINSDDAEMARRLNQEAAKSVKYGGMSEEDALKLVTLNPAKMLHLDNRMGSIKVGKDADLVLWTDNPLSIYAVPVRTIIEGAVFYDRDEDQKRQAFMKAERERIIQRMLDAKKAGDKTRKKQPEKMHLYHCDDLEP
ncbi:MAG TPA: amidohydrolase family protein [Luteibaculaceae bacterium]|nr:amidohydrolase family protein [Luteibaculaceae bacterium]